MGVYPLLARVVELGCRQQMFGIRLGVGGELVAPHERRNSNGSALAVLHSQHHVLQIPAAIVYIIIARVTVSISGIVTQPKPTRWCGIVLCKPTRWCGIVLCKPTRWCGIVLRKPIGGAALFSVNPLGGAALFSVNPLGGAYCSP